MNTTDVNQLVKHEIKGCESVILELFQGTYETSEYQKRDDEEMIELWKTLETGELARFQVFKKLKSGAYDAYLYYGENDGNERETWLVKDID